MGRSLLFATLHRWHEGNNKTVQSILVHDLCVASYGSSLADVDLWIHYWTCDDLLLGKSHEPKLVSASGDFVPSNLLFCIAIDWTRWLCD